MMKGEMRRLTLTSLAILISAGLLAAQGHAGPGAPPRRAWPERTGQGRSVVMSRQGIVAAENPLAAAIGAQILAEGGNAVDAILATNAAMGVTEPMMNGLGGDLFAIVYIAPHGGQPGRLYGLNASGWSPQRLTIAFLHQHGFRHMPQHGVYSITVPGVVAGWAQLRRRFGTMSWRQILTPAIALAQTGFPVPAWDALYWRYGSHLRGDPTAAHIYLPGGRPPAEGQVFRNPTLARSLTLLAQGGRSAFYDGPLAQRIVRFMRRQGSPVTLADFRAFHAEWVQPLSVVY
ncbi:MAG: gamma-glutamyltransferase, partial [Terriglobales bacterium]